MGYITLLLARWCLSSSIVCRSLSSLTLPAGGRANRPPSARAVGRPTFHGGPVLLRPVRATPCITVWVGPNYTILALYNMWTPPNGCRWVYSNLRLGFESWHMCRTWDTIWDFPVITERLGVTYLRYICTSVTSPSSVRSYVANHEHIPSANCGSIPTNNC